jgi:hypothetical protein
LAKKKTKWKEDLFFSVKLAPQKLSKYYAKVTPTPDMLLISTHILDPFRKLRWFGPWDKVMDINPEDEILYTGLYPEAFLNYVEIEYCTQHRYVPVNKLETVPRSNLVPSATPSGSYPSSFDPYDFFSNDEEYLMTDKVAERTTGRSDHAAPY